MTDHTIKLSRARAISKTGRYPGTYDAMLAHIPTALVASASAAVIAATIDAMASACAEAKALAGADAISEGAVWDAKRQTLRGIV
jgi:hypothetical protein